MKTKIFKLASILCLLLLIAASVSAQESKYLVPDFSFGVAADPQYVDADPGGPVGTRYYRASVEKLENAVNHFNEARLAFAIELGDMIDHNVDSSYKIMNNVWDKLNIPHYQVIGNHDFGGIEGEKTREYVLPLLGLKRGYYDFVYQGWRFVVLDCSDLSMFGNPKGSDNYNKAKGEYDELKARGIINAQVWNGGLSEEQITWLRQTLQKATDAGEKAIVFCHIPLFPPNQHNLWGNNRIMKILESYPCVMAYVDGHNHAGNYGVKNGIHYLNLHGMCETPENNAYAIFEVYKDHIRVIGNGREPNRILPFLR